MSLLVAVTGGSGSGKSTLAGALVAALPSGAGVIVSEDWYYHDFAAGGAFDPSTTDFDDIAARDHDRLIGDLERLRSGLDVLAPRYSFVRHGREPDGRRVAPAPVVVVEGAQLLCVPALAALFDLRIYVDAPDDIRFIRRLLRDQSERGRSVSSVVTQYLATVRPAHERLTASTRSLADIVVRDDSAAVNAPDEQTLQRLLAPALRHPALASLQPAAPPRAGQG